MKRLVVSPLLLDYHINSTQRCIMNEEADMVASRRLIDYTVATVCV